MSTNSVTSSEAFLSATAPHSQKRKRKKSPPPFSLRLSTQERTDLEAAAAGMPLGPFIKAKALGGDLTQRRTRGAAPVKDHAALARALGLLGNLRLANNLIQPSLGVRGRICPDVTSITLRQIQREEIGLLLDTTDHNQRFTKVSLRMSRRMAERHKHLA